MLKKILNFLCLTLFFSSSVLAAPEALKLLEEKPSPLFKLPTIQRQEIAPGFKVLFLEDHELPVVRGFLYFDTGSIYETPQQLGVAALTGELLRSGGTQSLKPEQVDQWLNAKAAKISIKVTREFGLLAFQCLREDFKEVLSLIFEMLTKPRFDEKRFELAKAQLIQEIRSQKDEPDELALREFPKVVLGKDNIWARTATESTVSSLTRQQVVQFFQERFFSDKSVLAIAGDLKAEEAFSIIKKTYAEATSSSQNKLFAGKDIPVIPPLEKTFSPETVLIPKKTDQSTLLLGHLGDKRTNPDKYALLLLNEILGGSAMNSRLGARIRTQLGLAYTVQSRFGLEKDLGVFWIFTQTKNATTDEALREIKGQLNDLVLGKNLTDQELDIFRSSLLNSLYSQYEPQFNFLKEEARFEYLDYPPNYLETFRKEIAKVKLEDLQRVAKQYLRPDALKVLIVGDPEKLNDDLKKKIWELN